MVGKDSLLQAVTEKSNVSFKIKDTRNKPVLQGDNSGPSHLKNLILFYRKEVLGVVNHYIYLYF